MNAQELAAQIVGEVERRERDMISPGNLQWVELSEEEATTLGIQRPPMGLWKPHTTLSQLRKIAEG